MNTSLNHSFSTLDPAPCTCAWEQSRKDGPDNWGPVPHERSAWGSRLPSLACTILAVEPIWGVNQQIKMSLPLTSSLFLFISFSSYNTVFQVNTFLNMFIYLLERQNYRGQSEAEREREKMFHSGVHSWTSTTVRARSGCSQEPRYFSRCHLWVKRPKDLDRLPLFSQEQ